MNVFGQCFGIHCCEKFGCYLSAESGYMYTASPTMGYIRIHSVHSALQYH